MKLYALRVYADPCIHYLFRPLRTSRLDDRWTYLFLYALRGRAHPKHTFALRSCAPVVARTVLDINRWGVSEPKTLFGMSSHTSFEATRLLTHPISRC